MKKLSRFITVFLAAALFFTGTPLVQTFAAEEETKAPVAEETVSNENAEPEKAEEPAPEVQPAPEQPAVPEVQPAPEAVPEPQPVAEEVQPAPEQVDAALTEEVTDPALLAGEPTEEGTDDPENPGGTGEPETPGEGDDPADPADPGDDPEKPDEPEVEKVTLSVTNNTNMFKVVSAYIETKENKKELVIALSGISYDNLFIGTFEEAVATGYAPAKWVKYFTDENGKKAFRIPITDSSSYLPVVSISNTYLQNYLKNKNSLSRAFYARQMVLNQSAKTLVAGDYETSQTLMIKNNVSSFKADSAVLYTIGGPNNNGYESNLLLTMKSDAYDQAFIGTKKQAASAKKTLKLSKNKVFTLPMKWLETFGDPDSLVSLIGKEFTISFHSKSKDKWVERAFTVKEKNATLTIDEKDPSDSSSESNTPAIPGQKSKEKKKKATTGGSTGAVDNATGLKDGVYTPDKFSFSGGSGRVVLSCSKVEVKNGKAYATIVFQNIKSGVTEFSYVKANGQQYGCSQVGGTSVVTIPVELNANTTLLGMTTKMSAAHEIAYTIFVYIAGADKKNKDDLKKNKELDEKAPEIAGLEAAGEENLEHAEYFKVFNYSDGIRLLEVDMRLSKDKNKKTADSSEEAKKEEEVTEESVIDEETGEEVKLAADKSAAQAKLYKGDVIKYLLVPKGVDIPAGLDKETIVVQLPLKSVYAGDEEIQKTMEKLGVEKRITCMEKEDGDIAEAGAFGDLSLRTMVKEKCDIVLVPGAFLKEENGRETFNSQAEDLSSLDITLIADRSADEKTKKAQAEWLKVYGYLFGCEKEAEQAFSAVK